MYKKGQTQATLVKLVLAMFSIGVMVAIVNLFLTGVQEFIPDEACRLSVLARSTVITEAIGDTPILCSEENVGELDGDREEIKRQIADMAASCWRMYGEGQIDSIWNDNERKCGTCYIFSVPDDMDKGNQSIKDYVEEDPKPNNRAPDVLTASELSNYFASNSFNAGLLYGGSSYNYYTDHFLITGYEFIDTGADTVNLNYLTKEDIGPQSVYVIDKTSADNGFFNQASLEEINIFGDLLQQFGVGNFLVVAADDFSSMRQSRFSSLAENLDLANEDIKDSVIIAVERSSGRVQLHLGIEHERYILENQITRKLGEFFSSQSIQGSDPNTVFNDAFQRLLKDLKTEVFELDNQNTGNDPIEISRNSYLSYLTNSGATILPISGELEAGTTYTITFVHDDYENFNTFANRMGWGAGQGAVFGTVAVVACGAAGLLTLGIGGLFCTAGAVALAGVGFWGGTGMPSMIQRVSDTIDSWKGEKFSLIAIKDLNTMGGECNYE